MYNGIKLAAAFIFGAGVGVLGTRQYFKLKYEEIANEEIESVKQSMSFRSGHILEETSIEKPEEFANKVSNAIEDSKLYSSIEVAKQEKIVKEQIEKAKAEAEHPEDDRSEDIFEITEEEYSETELGFEKKTMHYYTDDDMLVNADDGDWTNQEFNAECIDKIRDSDDTELYFRDDANGIDYEVLRIRGAYYIDM